MSMRKWIIPASFMLLLVSGCQNNLSNNDEASYDLQNDRSTPNYMSNRAAEKQHLVENDITDQNPNFLDLDRTGSGGEAGASNLGIDVDKATQVINMTKGFKADSVWINGDKMYVTANVKGNLSNGERKDAEARLKKKLTKALPRYNIIVDIKD